MVKRKMTGVYRQAKKSKTGAVRVIQRAAKRLISKRRTKYVRRVPKAAFMPEQKLLALTKRNERPTIAIQLNAQASYKGFVIGNAKPSSWGGDWETLAGIVIPQGSGATQRNGQYVYLKHSNVFYNIDTQANATTTPPMECRVIVFRARRAVNPAGLSYDPSTSLLLDDVGTPTGHSVSGVNGYDLTRRLLNRRDWIIKRDSRFMVSAPYNTSPNGEVNGYTGKYPCMKNFQFKLPYNHKTRYNDQNLPEDCAYHWGMVLYVRSIGKDTPTTGALEVNIRGNTVFLDP